MGGSIPRWLPVVGWALIVVGALSVIGDIAQGGSGFGLALDLVLDAFLVLVGLLIVASSRR
jgi:hypothetical protein